MTDEINKAIVKKIKEVNNAKKAVSNPKEIMKFYGFLGII